MVFLRMLRPTWRRAVFLGGMLVGAAVCSGQEATLSLSPPYSCEDAVCLDYEVRHLLGDSALEAIESGLPATLNLGFELWLDRRQWWDSQLQTTDLTYRIFYDTLEEKYDVYDETGLLVRSCPDVLALTETVCQGQAVAVTDLSLLEPEQIYFVAVTMRLELIDVDSIRDLEGWVRGGDDGEKDDSPGVPSHVLGLMKDLVGLGERRVEQRSQGFGLNDLTSP